MLPLPFLRRHWRLIAFGFFMCFCSNLGQTFFISLFGGEIRQALSISHGTFGSLYSLGTLASAVTIIWLGRLIDYWPLWRFALAVLLGLALTCLAMGQVVGLVGLTLAIYGLRLFGQGLSVHTGITAMARYFEAERGRTVSLATLGNTVGEAALPPLVVLALTLVTWHQVWTMGGVVLLALAPLIFVLLRGHGQRDRELTARRRDSGAAAHDQTLGQVLKDLRLWLMLPALLAPSFIFTGLIFHQVYLAEVKGWPLSLLAGSYSVMAVASVAALLLSGPLVDRLSARRLVPYFLVPLFLACVVLASSDGYWVAPVFMALFGINAGLTVVLTGAIWAELYGLSHLGAIRSFGAAAMVFSTGLAPAVLGLLIDLGVTLERQSAVMGAYCILASGLGAIAVHRGRAVAQG